MTERFNDTTLQDAVTNARRFDQLVARNLQKDREHLERYYRANPSLHENPDIIDPFNEPDTHDEWRDMNDT